MKGAESPSLKLSWAECRRKVGRFVVVVTDNEARAGAAVAAVRLYAYRGFQSFEWITLEVQLNWYCIRKGSEYSVPKLWLGRRYEVTMNFKLKGAGKNGSLLVMSACRGR